MTNKIILKCVICNKGFSLWPYEIKNNRKFCSKKCYWASMTGSVNPKSISNTKLYRTWRGIQNRCYNTHEIAYIAYGGRGIKCLWKSFNEFKNDMNKGFLFHINKFGEKDTTLDRINNNGNYCKENCRWATCKEQARNRRNRVEITYQGKTMSTTEWAEYLKIPKIALWLRLFRYNWPIDKAFTKHIIKRN